MSANDSTSKLLAAMESELSGVSDGNNSGLPPASDSATVLPVVSLPFSNLANDDPLRGLAVSTAKVAGEAEPQRSPSIVKPALQSTNKSISELVENNIDVIVPVMKTINTTISLDSVYAFKGIQKLVGRLNLGQKQGIINLYLCGLEVGFMEQPFLSFGNWFKDLRFANAILHPEDGNKIWHFAMYHIIWACTKTLLLLRPTLLRRPVSCLAINE
jgi:hypothetical protein